MSYDLMGRGSTARPLARAAGPGMKAIPAVATAAALAVVLALAACGKEGPPTPPLRAVPAPAKDLAVRQRGTHVLLSFTYPQTTPGGAALNGVTKVEVYEAVLQPPPPLKEKAKPPEKKPASSKGSSAKAAASTSATAAPGAGGTGAAGPSGEAGVGVTGGAVTAGGTTAAGAGAPAGSAAAGGSAAASAGAGGGAGAGGTSTGTTTPAAAAAPSTPPMPSPLDPRQYEGLAKVRLTLTSKELGAATLGNQLIIDLPLPEPLPAATAAAPAAPAAVAATAKATAGAPTAAAPRAGAASAPAAAGPTHDYAVRAYGPQGDRSAFSNQVMLIPKVPPPSPEGVTVSPQADGILAAWKAVPNVGGYAVYRRAATERFSSKPLALARAGETRHLDQTARFGQSYIYSVTAVDAKEPLVESAIKAEQEIHYVDVYPPPVPEELVAVAEAGRARLVWRQSEAPDLGGYIVYRRSGKGDFVRLTAKPITATNYVDTAVASGQGYDYRVTAIDQTGNESAPSAEVHVAVP